MQIDQVRQILSHELRLPNADAEAILANVTGRNTAWLRANGDAELAPKMEQAARDFAARRATGEPLEYIFGTAGFRGEVFLVDSSVLVPRPETEHLVDDALKHLGNWDGVRALDVGTGSGAIACSLALALPSARIDAVDVSPDALLVAIANVNRLGLEQRVRVFLGDLVEPVKSRRYDAILANLPYVPSADIAPAPDPVSFEPRLALDGGPDGLAYYRRFLEEVPFMFVPGGMLYMETAPPVVDGLVALAKAAFPHGQVAVGEDYGGRARYVKVTTTG